jgi:CheY-like chemotaxis protein
MPKKVLIAESNPLLLEAFENVLTFWGFLPVATTPRRSDVAALAEKFNPDILLVDSNLSGDGLAGLAEIKRLKEQIPRLKIVVVGYQEPQEEYDKKFREDGFDGFWNKFDPQSELLEILTGL